MPESIARLNAALERRYRIERELGEGGMAIVYLADDLRHDRRVALKVLKPEVAALVGAERFLAEIKITAGLQHPHILPLHDSGEADGFLFFVAPFVEEESLRQRIGREGQLPVEEAVAIATKVAGALHYAHEHGVIHRDVKPGNILLHRGEPVLADFGIALAVGAAGGRRLTETGLSLGTPHYMSPEQATGDQQVGPPSDIYALACVLYEMLVGEPPYTGSTPQAILGKIIAGRPDSASEHRASVPANVDAAIRKSLERVPADRFAQADHFAKALHDADFRHRPGSAVGDPASVAFRRALALAGTALVMVVSLGVGWLLLRPTPSQPTYRFELPIPDGLALYTNAGVSLDVSPDGSSIVFVAGPPGAGEQLWLRRLDQLQPIPIPETEGARNPRFSIDGASIAFTANGSLTVVSLTDRSSRVVVTDSVPNGFGGLAWGADGMLYFRKAGLGIWRVPADGGEEEEVTALAEGEGGHSWLDALPNGRGILFTRDVGGPSDDQIAVLSMETGEIRVLFRGAMARYAQSGHIVYTSEAGTLFAAPFDPDRLQVSGDARAVLDGIQVLGGSPSYFALSRTGLLLYRPIAAIGEGTPVWVMRDGTEEVWDTGRTGLFQDPAVSPDGRKVAFTYTGSGAMEPTGDIWIYDLDQATFERLTYEGRNMQPFWSPDGSEVGFSAERGNLLGLYARAADLSGDERLLARGQPLGLSAAQWAPDGGSLIYQRGTNSPAIDLWYSAPDPDSAPVALLATPFMESSPTLSPDGRWFAYQSNESGRAEIYVRPFPGPGGRISISVDGGVAPRWDRNGRQILYIANGSLNAATVRTTPDFAVVSREELFSWEPYQNGDYDSSPDGGRLLAIRTVPGSAPAVRDVVVVNFFEQLRQQVQ